MKKAIRQRQKMDHSGAAAWNRSPVFAAAEQPFSALLGDRAEEANSKADCHERTHDRQSNGKGRADVGADLGTDSIKARSHSRSQSSSYSFRHSFSPFVCLRVAPIYVIPYLIS